MEWAQRRRSTDQLVVVELGTAVVHGEPPGGRADGCRSDVAADRHVAEEEPVADERFLGAARRLVHDLQVGRVEAERGRRQAVRHQIDPQQLDRDQRLGHAERRRQEDADHLHPRPQPPAAGGLTRALTSHDRSFSTATLEQSARRRCQYFAKNRNFIHLGSHTQTLYRRIVDLEILVYLGHHEEF